MYLNNFDLWNIFTGVWNAGRNLLQKLESHAFVAVILLTFGFIILLPEYPALAAPAVEKVSRNQSTYTNNNNSDLSKAPFNVPAIIEKAEHIIQKEGQQNGSASDHYLVDAPEYQVKFNPTSVIYYQKQNEKVLDKSGLEFILEAVKLSDKKASLPISSSITVVENRLINQRTSKIKEVYEAKRAGVEQSWVIEAPLSNIPSDIIIQGKLATSLLPAVNNRGGIDFSDRDGKYVTTYGEVVVIDNNGKTITISPAYNNNQISITVPAEWLANAAYPVVVDPLIGANIRVDNLTTTDNYPAIAFGTTNYLIAWQTGTPNATGTGTSAIRGVRVNTAGTILDATPLLIGDTASRDDEFPSVTYDSVNARYIVAWMTWSSATIADINGSTIAESTGTVATAFATIVGSTRILAYPSVACCDVNNNYYVVYGRSAAGVTNFTAYRGQTNNRTTNALVTANLTVTATVSSGTITPNTEPRSAPKLYSLSTTKYLMAWETFGVDTNGDISANLLTVTVTPAYTWGTQVSVAAAAATLERYPNAAYDGTNALIVYQLGATTNADVYGRFVTPGAANLTLGTAYAVSNVAGSMQTYPNVAYTAGTCSATPINRYMVVWQDYRNNATNPDIYGSTMTTAGVVEAAVALSTNTTYIKQLPTIAADSGSCGYMTAWSDYRNNATTSSDIYAQKTGYPNISNLSPTSGAVGASISINGLNFGADPGAGSRSTATNNVKLNGVQIPDANVTLWSDAVVTFTIPTGTTAGTYPVTVTAGSWTSNSSNLTVNAFGPATKVAFTTQPVGGSGGTAWATQPVATIQDAGGNTVTTATNSVTLAIGSNPNSGILTCTSTTVTAVNGVATFAGCKIDKAGTPYTLTAAASGLTTGISNTFTITVGAAAQLAFTTQSGGGTGGTAWATQPAVTVQDAGGNTVTTATNSITLAIGTNPGSGTLTCTTNPLSAASGVAGFAGCKIDKAANGYTLTAAASGLTGATSSALNIIVGSAVQLGFTTQPGNGTGGTASATQPVVAVQDAGGNTVTSAVNSITLAIGTNPGSGTLTCTTNPVSAVSGVAGFAGCKIDKAANGYTLTAAASGLTGATSLVFNIAVGPAAQLVISTQPSNGITNAALLTQPVVTIQDAGGNTVTTASNSITLAIGTNPSSGILTCTANPLAAVSGVANFAGCKIDKAGNGYTLTVSATGLTGATSISMNIVDPLQITTVSLSNGYEWLNYSVTVTAAGGVTPYTWSVIAGSLPTGLTLNSGSGLISGTPSAFGTYNFTIQVTDLTTPVQQTVTKAFTVTIYQLSTIAVTPVNPVITQGQTIQFTATGTYSDNSTSNITSIVTWNSTNTLIATVNATGLASGAGLGNITISAIK